MAKLLIADSFLDSLAELDEPTEQAVWSKLELVSAVPGCGSSLASDSLRRTYGPACLKVAVKTYVVLYDYDEHADEVYVFGIVPQRRVC